MSSDKRPDLTTCKVIGDSDDYVRIVDRNNTPIATIRAEQDEWGRSYSQIVFRPDVADRIVNALDLAAAVDALTGKDEA